MFRGEGKVGGGGLPKSGRHVFFTSLSTATGRIPNKTFKMSNCARSLTTRNVSCNQIMANYIHLNTVKAIVHFTSQHMVIGLKACEERGGAAYSSAWNPDTKEAIQFHYCCSAISFCAEKLAVFSRKLESRGPQTTQAVCSHTASQCARVQLCESFLPCSFFFFPK